jgi:hypothetical protein
MWLEKVHALRHKISEPHGQNGHLMLRFLIDWTKQLERQAVAGLTYNAANGRPTFF